MYMYALYNSVASCHFRRMCPGVWKLRYLWDTLL